MDDEGRRKTGAQTKRSKDDGIPHSDLSKMPAVQKGRGKPIEVYL